MAFTVKDFDSLISKNKSKARKVDGKLLKLVERAGGKLDYFSGTYKHKNRHSGFFSKTRERKAFFNLQINSEDLSLEFQVEGRRQVLKFLKNAKLGTLKKLKKLGDCEIAVWDKGKKVCKLYPAYIDKPALKFLSNKIKSTKNPVLKIRKIYSRDEPILRSAKLADDVVRSIKKMEVLYGFV